MNHRREKVEAVQISGCAHLQQLQSRSLETAFAMQLEHVRQMIINHFVLQEAAFFDPNA